MLHRDAGFDLAAPCAPGHKEHLQAAEEGFAHWFERAQRFYKKGQFSTSQGWQPDAAFDLHQATESAYKAVLIVFTGYIPKEHYLELLGHTAAELDPRIEGVFPRTDTFQRNAFDLLDYAYIGARYDPKYRIDAVTVNYLAEKVAQLLSLTETACKEKIDTLRLQGK